LALCFPDAWRFFGVPQEQSRRPETEAASERGKFIRFLPTIRIASQHEGLPTTANLRRAPSSPRVFPTQDAYGD